MANQVASPVDGVVVVQDPDQRMTWWAMDQLYLGAEGRNKYVGKIGDYVIDRSIPWQPKVYVITAISDLLIATFRLVSFYANSEENELTSFVGVGPGQINNNTRIYINKETMPYTCKIDTRMAVPGTMNNYARIYRGSVTAGNMEVISRMYDSLVTSLVIPSHWNLPMIHAMVIPPCVRWLHLRRWQIFQTMNC